LLPPGASGKNNRFLAVAGYPVRDNNLLHFPGFVPAVPAAGDKEWSLNHGSRFRVSGYYLSCFAFLIAQNFQVYLVTGGAYL
jgi:hypothetical protein